MFGDITRFKDKFPFDEDSRRKSLSEVIRLKNQSGLPWSQVPVVPLVPVFYALDDDGGGYVEMHRAFEESKSDATVAVFDVDVMDHLMHLRQQSNLGMEEPVPLLFEDEVVRKWLLRTIEEWNFDSNKEIPLFVDIEDVRAASGVSLTFEAASNSGSSMSP